MEAQSASQEILPQKCLLCITIIGIPFGKQFFKLARLSLFPFGKSVVRAD